MPTCEVCGEEDFKETDGLFFCTTCMTQSQDLRVLEQEDDAFDMNLGHQIRSKSTKEKFKKKKDLGRPWHTYEGFQIIIKKQVEALIEMGANPSLKDVVFRLWCTYLSKCGVAFPVDEEKQSAIFKSAQRHREKYPPTLENPKISAVKMKNAYRVLNQDTSAKAAAKASLKCSVEEEFYDSDDPADDNSDTDGFDDSDIDDDNIDEDDFKKRRKAKQYERNLRSRMVECMTMPKTLCFCLLGLMYTNPLTTIPDIIRWTRESKIPFTTASQLLPSDMKFSCYDNKAFVFRHPINRERLHFETSRLIRFLGLNDVPKNTTSELINICLVKLDLPGELHGLIQNLREACTTHRRYQLENYKRTVIQPFEAVAMAFIITTLELLLGLDGNTEKKYSKLSETLMHLTNSEHRLFIWEHWVQQKNHNSSIQSFTSTSFDVRDVTDVNAFVESHKLAPTQGGKYTVGRDKRKNLQTKTRAALQRPLNILSDKWKRTSDTGQVPSNETNCGNDYIQADVVLTNQISDTEEYNPEQQQTLTDDLISYQFNDLSNEQSCSRSSHQQALKSDLFRTSTLLHLTHPKAFCEILKEQFFNRRDSELDNKNERDNKTCETDEHSFTALKSKTSSVYVVSHDRKDPSYAPRLVVQEISNVHRTREITSDWLSSPSNQSIIYKWFLQVCCNMILYSPEDLDSYVSQLKDFLVTYAILDKVDCPLIQFLQNQR